jgi:hypothetical protein
MKEKINHWNIFLIITVLICIFIKLFNEYLTIYVKSMLITIAFGFLIIGAYVRFKKK